MTEVYYKIRQVFYYKMRQLLQNATILLQNTTVITKCNVCYKLWQYRPKNLIKENYDIFTGSADLQNCRPVSTSLTFQKSIEDVCSAN